MHFKLLVSPTVLLLCLCFICFVLHCFALLCSLTHSLIHSLTHSLTLSITLVKQQCSARLEEYPDRSVGVSKQVMNRYALSLEVTFLWVELPIHLAGSTLSPWAMATPAGANKIPLSLPPGLQIPLSLPPMGSPSPELHFFVFY